MTSNDGLGEIPSRPSGLRTKKREGGVAKLGHRLTMPYARALPSRFFVQQRERETVLTGLDFEEMVRQHHVPDHTLKLG